MSISLCVFPCEYSLVSIPLWHISGPLVVGDWILPLGSLAHLHIHVRSWLLDVTPQVLDVINFQIDVAHLNAMPLSCKCKWCLGHSSFASMGTSMWTFLQQLAKPWTFNWHKKYDRKFILLITSLVQKGNHFLGL